MKVKGLGLLLADVEITHIGENPHEERNYMLMSIQSAERVLCYSCLDPTGRCYAYSPTIKNVPT